MLICQRLVYQLQQLEVDFYAALQEFHLDIPRPDHIVSLTQEQLRLHQHHL